MSNGASKRATTPPTRTAETAILGNGEMARRIREYAWESSGLPAVEHWPHTLLTTVNLLLQSPVPIVMLWGGDGIMIYNDAYSIFAGKRHPQLLGSIVVEGWPEVADFNQHVMDTVYREGKTLSYKDQELTLYRNDRPEQVWMDLNYSPIIGDTGKPEGVFAIVTETTEAVTAQEGLRTAELALRSEQDRLRSVFAEAPALIAVVSGPQYVFEMANPLYKQVFAPDREIIGLPLVEAFPKVGDEGILTLLDTTLQTGEAYKGIIEREVIRQGGSELETAYFSLVYQPVRTGDGSAHQGSVFIHAVDITDQVKSRQEAERLSAELEAIFESLPDGVYTLDRESIRHINQRGAEMLGYGSPTEVPRNLRKLYADLALKYAEGKVTVDADNTVVGRAFAGEVSSHIGVRLANPKTGEVRYIRSAAAPIKDTGGKVIGAVATTSDMTEQYQLQEQMQKEVIRRRVLSQKTRLLKHQNDQLKVLNETKDEFIALTSHQLRTPATGVKQYLGMITQGFAGEITPQQRDFLERAYESNDRQLRIIDDILRVARIDLDQIKVVRHQEDLVGLIQMVAGEQSDTFTSRHQTLKLELPDEPVVATVDAQNLGMALGNIIDNASKYTANDKTITVSLEREGGKALIRVSDQGVGIDEKDMDKLFQKFYRIPNERSIEVGGTGLGLYLSQKLVEKHKGSISVTSVRDEGTTFTIKLPLRTRSPKR